MRKYEPIWLRLKLYGEASLAAPPKQHRRIVLAVRKEKTKDIVWKLTCLEKRRRYRLYNKSENALLTFTLRPSEVLSFSTLSVNDL